MRDLWQTHKLQRQAGHHQPLSSTEQSLEMDFMLCLGASHRGVAKGLVPSASKQSVWEVVPYFRHKEEISSFIHLLTLDWSFCCYVAAFSHW